MNEWIAWYRCGSRFPDEGQDPTFSSWLGWLDAQHRETHILHSTGGKRRPSLELECGWSSLTFYESIFFRGKKGIEAFVTGFCNRTRIISFSWGGSGVSREYLLWEQVGTNKQKDQAPSLCTGPGKYLFWQTWIQVLSLSFTCCVNLGKKSNHSELPYLLSRRSSPVRIAERISGIMSVEGLAECLVHNMCSMIILLHWATSLLQAGTMFALAQEPRD